MIEKIIVLTGLTIAFIFFTCMFFFGSQFLVGTLIGLGLAGFGGIFLDE